MLEGSLPAFSEQRGVRFFRQEDLWYRPSVVRNLGNPTSSPSFNTSAEEAHQLKNYLVSLPSFVLQLRRRIVYCGRCCAVLLRPLRLCAQTCTPPQHATSLSQPHITTAASNSRCNHTSSQTGICYVNGVNIILSTNIRR